MCGDQMRGTYQRAYAVNAGSCHREVWKVLARLGARLCREGYIYADVWPMRAVVWGP